MLINQENFLKKKFSFFKFFCIIKWVGNHMKKLLTIVKDVSIKVSSQITDFLEPTHIYLPIDEETLQNIEIKKVRKGERLYSFENQEIYSSVSGRIVGFLKKENKKYLEIKNDYKEEGTYNGMHEFTTVNIKTNFKEKIKGYSYFNFDIFQDKKILILNGIEDEPYIANRPFLHKYETTSILEMLDCLAEVFCIPEIRLYLKENDRESIEAFQEYIGTYPNMKIYILPDYYPIGNEQIFKDFLKLNDSSIVLTTEIVYDLYVRIIREREKDVTYVTITGDAIENPQVFRVKIGSLASEIVDEYIEFKDKNYIVYLNGLMHRKEIDIEGLVISENVRAIYFMKPLLYNSKKCIHCGKCNEVCPRSCNPYLSVQTKGKFMSERCIQCGLCTFICPSFIDFSKVFKEEEGE